MYRHTNSDRIAEIVSRAQSENTESDAPSYAGFATFIRVLFEDAVQDELEAYNSDHLFHAALSFWRFSEQRELGEPRLRIFNPDLEKDGWHSPHSVLEIVADDMPFLVDSVLGELTAQNLRLHTVLHPIVGATRDATGLRTEFYSGTEDLADGISREAMVHIEFDRHADQKDLDALKDRIAEILGKVKCVVEDFNPMRARLEEAISGLLESPPQLEQEELEECAAFLSWLRDDHFAFLGSRIYRFDGEPETGDLVPEDDTGLGLLRDPNARMLRRGNELVSFTPEVREFLMLPMPIIITKANVRSIVHRRVYMDYVGIKLFDEMGQIKGECRFVGLFTAEAYNRSVTRIPLLSRKVERVSERAGFASASFNKKALKNIFENFPRDELFQISEDELLRVGLGILDLHERPRTRLFVRHDRYDRYVSCIVFIPRDRYDSSAREKVADILVNSYNGRLSAFYPQFNDTPLARIHYIIGRDPDDSFVRPDVEDVEAEIFAATRSFRDALSDALMEAHSEEEARALLARYGNAFSVSYQEANDAKDAAEDILKIEPLGPSPAISLRCYRREGDDPFSLRIKLYRAEEPVPLSDVLPLLENMGLKVVEEAGYPVHRGDSVFWVHDFFMEHPCQKEVNPKKVSANLEDTFIAIWHGSAENDRFNQLCLEQNLSWRYVSLLRAFAHYWRQTGRTLSVSYMQETLVAHPRLTSLLVELFEARFDSLSGLTMRERENKSKAIRVQILEALENVQSLDEDRIIRQFLNLISSLWRTNFYQRDAAGAIKPYISFKISSREIEDLPLPKPLTEIFVYSPRVEGVHLRWGLVARGGLRWSDRREDFRTEILGLAKAQQVKNAVIVPVGAKGGFVPKHLPQNGTREEIQEEGVACYRLFVSGLLDLADNVVAGEVVKPDGVIAHDGDDPYLVVAADKGTATFSDIANEVSKSYGFWLGDAFASGGSQGYDHKAMGITARGAWEAVKRHFREIGKDIQTEPFSAVGVGDMSGDVFGNGMLLSPQTRLLAAFDHRDIFIDPDPDPARSFEERKRMFALPRSSWADYDEGLISKGGGVYSRSTKAIELSPEAQAMLGVDKNKLAPNEVIRAILRSEADLLWFGGIGTYIKGSGQRNGDVGDKANDVVRIDAEEVRVKIIGEGANLGVTQEGRIAYARAGGRINTDAVDNAAGVDCSDHEVNIKILLNAAETSGRLTEEERNTLLSDMTDDVASLVLENNYEQTLALTLSQRSATDNLDAHRRFMLELERHGQLNRAVEGLPSDEGLEELALAGTGLTRPELAVLMAYAKITLFDDLIASDVPDAAYLQDDLRHYFPAVLDEKFSDLTENHQLRREIIATKLAGELVNIGGITYVNRLREDMGTASPLIVRAFVASMGMLQIRPIRERIHELDNKVGADIQASLYYDIRSALKRQALWLLRFGVSNGGKATMSIEETIEAYGGGVSEIKGFIQEHLSPLLAKRMQNRQSKYVEAGVSVELASDVILLEPLAMACDIIDVSRAAKTSFALTTRLFFLLGDQLGIDYLSAHAGRLRLAEHWERLAVRRIVDDLYQHQRTLVELVLHSAGSCGEAEACLEAWMAQHQSSVERTKALVHEMESGGALTVAKLSLAGSQIRELTTLAATRASAKSEAV